MARVAAYVPDLLFGSNVLGMLRAGGHDAQLISSLDELAGAGERDAHRIDVLVVDLTADAEQRIREVRERRPAGARTLAFYSHVEVDVRTQAQRAGFDLVVPRSRMAREGGALVSRLAEDEP